MQAEELRTTNEQLESRTEEAEQKTADLQITKLELEEKQASCYVAQNTNQNS